MNKYKYVKHGALYDSLENLNIHELEKSFESLKSDDLTAEGFIGSFISKIARMFRSSDKIPDSNIVINRKFLRENNVKAVLDKAVFAKIAPIRTAIDPNFTGNRSNYLTRLTDLYKLSLETLDIVLPEVTDLIETAYAEGRMTSAGIEHNLKLEEFLKFYEDFRRVYFAGSDDHALINDMFDNNKDILDYMARSTKVTAHPIRLKSIKRESETLAGRLKVLRTKDIDINKATLKQLSKLVMNVAILHSDTAKLFYLMDNNMNFARIIFFAIRDNISK